jgi:hypothetical protein
MRWVASSVPSTVGSTGEDPVGAIADSADPAASGRTAAHWRVASTSQPASRRRALAAYARTVRVRADSTLAAISDDDFERGMAALDRTAAEGRHAGPVITGLDLLMLR